MSDVLLGQVSVESPQPRRVKNCKAKGSRNEYKSRRLFEAHGYTVIKSGGSLGPFDLIALRDDGGVACQVKTNRGPSSVEIEAMRTVSLPGNFLKVIHVWHDFQRRPTVRDLSQLLPTRK
jgi:hypothetical protein